MDLHTYQAFLGNDVEQKFQSLFGVPHIFWRFKQPASISEEDLSSLQSELNLVHIFIYINFTLTSLTVYTTEKDENFHVSASMLPLLSLLQRSVDYFPILIYLSS